MQVSFDIYNTEAVNRLKEENPDILPTYSVDSDVDQAYNKSQINGVIESAIIQGKSVGHIAEDLQNRLQSVNEASARRAARTAITCSQNSGCLEGWKDARDKGVNVKKQWIASLDSHTRESHAELDQEIQELDDDFSNGLQYPGDPNGDPSEVYNCRCSMKGYLPDYDTDTEDEGERFARDPETGEAEYVSADMSYSEWMQTKTHNWAKAEDFIWTEMDKGDISFTPEVLVNEVEKSQVGKDTIKAIEDSKVSIQITEGAYNTGYRGEQIGNQIKLYANNISSNRIAAQTLIHEMAHYRFNIGYCQHAEAICFAYEKMHLMNRNYLTKEEWEYVKKLAIDNYPEYNWEKGGYGDYEQFDFVR